MQFPLRANPFRSDKGLHKNLLWAVHTNFMLCDHKLQKLLVCLRGLQAPYRSLTKPILEPIASSRVNHVSQTSILLD